MYVLHMRYRHKFHACIMVVELEDCFRLKLPNARITPREKKPNYPCDPYSPKGEKAGALRSFGCSGLFLNILLAQLVIRNLVLSFVKMLSCRTA